MDTLTLLESQLLETLHILLSYLNKRQLTRTEYMDLKGETVKAIRKAENVKWGCSTGNHNGFSRCHCPQRKAA